MEHNLQKQIIAPKDMKRVATLEIDFNESYSRRSGNTTRLIDAAIQILFDGNACVVRDHYKAGLDRDANMMLFRKITERLRREHAISFEFGNLGVDLNDMVIWLANL